MSQEPLLTAFTKLRTNLLQMTKHLLRDEEEASDALQEAFCRLWTRREKIKNEQEASALAVTTVKNICIDVLRKDKNIHHCELDTDRDSPLSDSVQEEMERKERFDMVNRIIENQLSALQQKILRMKDLEGREIDEIAIELQMQPTAVRMNLSRARKTVREQYNSLNA